jgi:hypothetical protein
MFSICRQIVAFLPLSLYSKRATYSQPPKSILFPLMAINQPLVIIIRPVPKKRGVFGCPKVLRGCIKAYAGQNERTGHPILAHLSGVQAATEQMKAPVTPPTQRHALDSERIRYHM